KRGPQSKSKSMVWRKGRVLFENDPQVLVGEWFEETKIHESGNPVICGGTGETLYQTDYMAPRPEPDAVQGVNKGLLDCKKDEWKCDSDPEKGMYQTTTSEDFTPKVADALAIAERIGRRKLNGSNYGHDMAHVQIRERDSRGDAVSNCLEHPEGVHMLLCSCQEPPLAPMTSKSHFSLEVIHKDDHLFNRLARMERDHRSRVNACDLLSPNPRPRTSRPAQRAAPVISSHIHTMPTLEIFRRANWTENKKNCTSLEVSLIRARECGLWGSSAASYIRRIQSRTVTTLRALFLPKCYSLDRYTCLSYSYLSYNCKSVKIKNTWSSVALLKKKVFSARKMHLYHGGRDSTRTHVCADVGGNIHQIKGTRVRERGFMWFEYLPAAAVRRSSVQHRVRLRFPLRSCAYFGGEKSSASEQRAPTFQPGRLSRLYFQARNEKR
ncbi:unnamed protein product, partial [Nesidiocoris tenuis]